jgi:homoserine kinase
VDAPSESLTVFAPGSASNLGAGFDCLGVALTGMGDRVRVRRAGPPGVRVVAVSEPRIPKDPERNTGAIAAFEVLKRAKDPCGLEMEIEKGLPLAAGLGGSAASAVGGAVAANLLLGTGLSAEELLAIALVAESAVSGRHPDNAAPCLLGGAVLVQGLDPVRTVRLKVHESLAFLLAVPGYEVETARARGVLPEEVPRALAVSQAAGLGSLVLGLERGDGDLLRDGMRDRIAEPARLVLYPGYAPAAAAALEAGAFGVAVSGAGPSLVAIAPKDASPRVGSALVEGFGKAGIAAAVHEAKVDEAGARVVA